MLAQKLNQINEISGLTLNLIVVLMVGSFFSSCTSSKNSSITTVNNLVVISEITTNQTSLSKKDVVNYFCSSLTDYFNTYKYYRISSSIYSIKERQNSNSSTKVKERGSIYDVEYIGAAGIYTVSFSNKELSDFEQIFTFARGTSIGNFHRKKVYDTFVAWMQRVEISLKANSNTYLYADELNAGIELENWYNSLN